MSKDNCTYKDIVISEHICLRYIQRFNPNLESIPDYNRRLIAAKEALKAILKDARYLSDSKEGVLLYSDIYKAKLVVRDRTLITILAADNKIKIREKKREENNGR